MRKLPANSHSSGPTATAPVVDSTPPTTFVATFNPESARGGAIRAQVVGDRSIGNEGVFLQKFAHQFQRGGLVSLGLDKHVEDLAFRVDGAPQVDHASVDFQIRFVRVPNCVRSGTALAQIRCDHRPEMIDPASDRFVRDRYAPFGQQIFDVSETQGEP